MVGEVVYFPLRKKNNNNNKNIMTTFETFSCAGIEMSVNSEHLPYNIIYHTAGSSGSMAVHFVGIWIF